MPVLLLFVCFFLFSCAHQQKDAPTHPTPPPVESALRAPEDEAPVAAQPVAPPPDGTREAPQTVGSAGEQKPPVKETPRTLLEEALVMVKNNAVQKRWSARQDDIAVYANFSIGGVKFTAVYDILHASLREGGYFQVPFLIETSVTGETLIGNLDWHIQHDDSGVLLSFDDDYIEAWEGAFALFDRYGARVTFFVQGKPLGFAKRALARGHDVGYHTIHHLNLSQVSRAVFIEETTSEIAAFRKAGIPLRSFAYPYGLSSPWMHEELFHSFTILRGYGVTFRLYDAAAIKQGYIAAKAIDNILYTYDKDFHAIVTLMLRAVKFTGSENILPLCTHNISNRADWGITPARLEYLLKAAQDLKLKFYCYKDFM
ncbi:MAG: polysaccharide deacetylase family protein [Treponema sp.]|jgi:peptidoglycan/xylan/chitin deacetylase (PgdA/CDA1 family)|nr:polysaccharide deacetylase family protein [Treponema sp.]